MPHLPPSIHILRDLLAGQSTIDSISQRQNYPEDQVTVALVILKQQGLVASHPIASLAGCHAYRITYEGKQFLTAQASCQPPKKTSKLA